MSFQGLGFVTHREIESLLGGGVAGARQRRRLVDRGWLPRAPLIFADRRRVAIYPEFCLSALVVAGSASESLRRQLERAAASAEQLYGSGAFRGFRGCLAEALDQVGHEDIVGFARCAAELDASVFGSWRDEVEDCALSLADMGIEFEALPARITAVGDVYVVDVRGATEPHPVEDAPQLLELGALVTRDRVRVASSVRDFLLPVPEIASIGLVSHHEHELADEDELTRLFFEDLGDHLRDLPSLGAAREVVDQSPVAVALPWQLLAGSNSMSRRALHH